MNDQHGAIQQGWDYVDMDPFDKSPPEPRAEPLSGEEKMALAVEAQGSPPCGAIGDVKGRCKWWKHCASQQMACAQYLEWQSRVGACNNKAAVAKRASRVRERVPSREIFDKIFAATE